MIDRERLAELREQRCPERAHPSGECLDGRSGMFCRQCEIAGSVDPVDREILDTLSALLTVKEAAEYVICWHKPGSIVGWDELTKALAAVKEGA